MSTRKEKPHLYVLDGHEVRGVYDIREWGRAFELSKRNVMRTRLIDGSIISTVFIGIDHGMIGKRKPLLFETALLSEETPCEVVARYATWAEAEAGHMQWLERCVPPDLIALTTKENEHDQT